MLEKIQNNEDILERGDIFANLEMSNIFPQYFIANIEKYKEKYKIVIIRFRFPEQCGSIRNL